jgi:hypothetical protein
VPPTVTGVSPSTGPPGTTVTITGTNLSNAHLADKYGQRPFVLAHDLDSDLTCSLPVGGG